MDINQTVDSVRVEETIQLLKKNISGSEIEPLIAALEALGRDSQNKVLLEQLTNTFNDLGIAQGSVLTYGPYVSILLSGNLFDDD